MKQETVLLLLLAGALVALAYFAARRSGGVTYRVNNGPLMTAQILPANLFKMEPVRSINPKAASTKEPSNSCGCWL